MGLRSSATERRAGSVSDRRGASLRSLTLPARLCAARSEPPPRKPQEVRQQQHPAAAEQHPQPEGGVPSIGPAYRVLVHGTLLSEFEILRLGPRKSWAGTHSSGSSSASVSSRMKLQPSRRSVSLC